MSVKSPRYPCPCCGYLVLQERPGSYDICPICFWEDDIVQLRDPFYSGGANKVSLIEAQRNYLSMQVSEFRFKAHVRSPRPSEVRETGWRPLSPESDNPERCKPEGGWACEWPADSTVLYWWRPTYWRRA
jgi:hypothetical protein